MHTEYFIVDNCCKGKVVENVGAVPPDIDGTVFPQTFVVEAINLCDLSALMISSDKSDALGVSHLEGKQEEESLHRIVTSIHEIAHEEVVCVGALTADFEKFLEVVKLAMDVTTNLWDWVKGRKGILTVTGLETCCTLLSS
jgi:hypothetical protein